MLERHDANPYAVVENGRWRARCRCCGERVVGTPVGWFHTSPDVTEASDPQVPASEERRL